MIWQFKVQKGTDKKIKTKHNQQPPPPKKKSPPKKKPNNTKLKNKTKKTPSIKNIEINCL